MRRLFLMVASLAIVFVCGASWLGHATEKPRVGKQENPKTPDEARGESGKDPQDARKSTRKVTLQVIIRPSGKAELVKVLEVIPKDLPKEVADDLVKKCIEAVKRLRFEPPMKDGRPVSQHAKIEYSFGNDENADKQK